ncbi:MAG: hypothetical protein ACI4CS_10860 [Candidatus Weimeria sp.]
MEHADFESNIEVKNKKLIDLYDRLQDAIKGGNEDEIKKAREPYLQELCLSLNKYIRDLAFKFMRSRYCKCFHA